jgi:uncharacterized protein
MKNAYLICFLTGICISFCSYSQKIPERSPDSRPILIKGFEQYNEGEYKKAAETFGSIHRNDTSYLLSLYEKALSLQADSSFEEALSTINLALEVNNNEKSDHDYLLLRANVTDDLGRPEEALKIYDAVLEKYPASLGARSQKVTTLFRLKRYEEAETLIRECIVKNFLNPLYHYKLGFITYNQGKILPAMMAFTMANIANPSHANKTRVVSYLSSICNAKDEAVELQQNRKAEDYPGVYERTEQIIFSKIALGKGYKSDLNLDDNIFKQIYVMMDKLKFEEASADPYMQLYVPFFKTVFEQKQAEVMLNHTFSGLEIKEITGYLKKNKSDLTKFTDFAFNYCDLIRSTRTINYKERAAATFTTYHYDGEKFFAEGKFENKGSEGAWKYYFPAGNVKAKGNFVQDKKDGEWTYYTENGKLQATEVFQKGNNEGPFVSYYTNGLPRKQAMYKDDKQEGSSKEYSRYGVLITEENYKADQLHGKIKYFYNDGRLKAEYNYKEGKLDGPVILYYQNQLIKEQGTYKNDELDGTFKLYYDNGQLKSELQYDNGKTTGVWKYYHRNGKLNYQTTLTDKGEEGEVIKYGADGEIESKDQYKAGVGTGLSEYYYNGKLYVAYKNNNKGKVSEVTYYDSTGKELLTNKRSGKLWNISYYSPLGFKTVEKTFDQDESLTGEVLYYNAEGTLVAKENYQKGLQEGMRQSWFANKKQSELAEYKEDKLHGTVKAYNTNGTLSFISFYEEGVLQDYQYDYNEVGSLISVYHYSNGEKDGYATVYYPNGKKFYQEKYSQGWLEEVIQFDTLGKTMTPIRFEKGSGIYKLFHPNGKLYYEQPVVNGVFEGMQKSYYPNGTIMNEVMYKNDQKEGTAKYYHTNGKLSAEGSFLYDLKTGTWKTYEPDGTTEEIEEYDEGQLNGICKYLEDGKITREIPYRAGERHGTLKRYSAAGELMFQIKYYNGNVISYTYLDKSKKLVPPVYFKNLTGNLVSYFPNGTKAADVNYTAGYFHGSFKLYNEKGVLVQESFDEYGVGTGAFSSYYDNGKIKISGMQNGGLVEGVYKQFYADGKLKEEAFYKDGQLHGLYKKYDAAGKLVETLTYYYGYITDIKK